MPVVHACSVIILLALPPYLLATVLFRDTRQRACAYAILVVVSAASISIGLHYLEIPIRRDSLLWAYTAYLLLTAVASLLHNQGSLFRVPGNRISRLYLLGAAIILFPYTRFTGIDTYKWQDLATAIRLDSCIPWLLHPLGLFGFLPRSYPTLQPAMLATIQIMGNLGVEGGFRVLSLLVLAVAFLSSLCWFSTILPTKYAQLASLLYVLSPVFVRFTHWATGRGLFMALFPTLLYVLAPAQSLAGTERGYPHRKRWLRYAGIVALSLLLLLTHKAAWIALPILLAAHLLCRAIPKRLLLKAFLLAPVLLIAVLISPRIGFAGVAGNTVGAIWLITSRFVWLFPLAIVGWLSGKSPLPPKAPYTNAMFLFCVPLALDPQMYGALIATPFIVAWAVSAACIWWDRASLPRKGLVWGFLIGISLAAALMVVVARSRMAATADVKEAATFLNQHDPYGPFLLHAPELERTRMQAYVTGCPRFVLSGSPKLVAYIPPLPWHAVMPSRHSVNAWTAWLRNIFQVDGLQVQWYGDVQRNYHVVIEGRGEIPPHAQLRYENPTVQVYEE